jgi:glycoprotein endo-alpha-1,2-mannosidase
MTKHSLAFLLCMISLIASSQQRRGDLEKVSYKVHTFYYSWYGSPEYDGKYSNWNHPIIPHHKNPTWNNAGAFPGGDDIGANYYPALGCYSSNDPNLISEHFKLIQKAGIGVCVISWWGKNSFGDKSIKKYLNIAQKYGIKIAFHIEPFYKSVEAFREQLEYLYKQYASHPSIFRANNKPLLYVYDSYKIKSKEWSRLLNANGDISLRNTLLDATVIGLWVHRNEGDFFIDSGFDGFYTYFASDGFVYGSTPANWKRLSKFAAKNNLIFIPSVGPGYIDTRIRPWNHRNTRDREKGFYYENMFKSAAILNPDYISITSFNEWHEGTQIEPAIPKTIPGFTYEDYGKDADPLFYIKKTKNLISEYQNSIKAANNGL